MYGAKPERPRKCISACQPQLPTRDRVTGLDGLDSGYFAGRKVHRKPKGWYIFKEFIRNPKTRGYGFFEMMFFLGVVTVGYFYLWRKGAFDWYKSQK